MKYKKYLKYMITIGTKRELHKTRPFGTKTQGDKFRYAVNFAIIAKLQGITKIQIFAMIAKFRYHSEKNVHSKISQGLRNFHYGCKIFAILANFRNAYRKSAHSPASIQSLFLQVLLTFLYPKLMKSSRIHMNMGYIGTNMKPSLE